MTCIDELSGIIPRVANKIFESSTSNTSITCTINISAVCVTFSFSTASNFADTSWLPEGRNLHGEDQVSHPNSVIDKPPALISVSIHQGPF